MIALISVLCTQGWTVRITGTTKVEVMIASLADSPADFAFIAFGDTVESALLDAATQLQAELGTMVQAISAYIPEVKQDIAATTRPEGA